MEGMINGDDLNVLVVKGPVACILFQAVIPKDPEIVSAWSDMENEYGYSAVRTFRVSLGVAHRCSVPLTALNRVEQAICRRLAELIAANIDRMNSDSCSHSFKEHLLALVELDNYFGGLQQAHCPIQPTTKLPEVAAEQLFNNSDLDFLKDLKIAV